MNAGNDPAPEITHAGSIEFAGAFEAVERAILAEQFSQCRFELLARSTRDPRIALVRWQRGPAMLGRGSPAPVIGPPRTALYVLDRSETRASATRPDERGATLVPVQGEADLRAAYPGHFEGIALAQAHLPWWERLARSWPRWLPLLMVVVVAIWLAALLSLWRS